MIAEPTCGGYTFGVASELSRTNASVSFPSRAYEFGTTQATGNALLTYLLLTGWRVERARRPAS